MAPPVVRSLCACGPSAPRGEEEGELICLSCGLVLDDSLLVASDDPAGRSFLQYSEHSDWGPVERRVQQMGAELGLHESCVQLACRLARSAMGKPRSGYVLESHVACALLLASRREQQHTVLTLREVSAKARCKPTLVGKCWMRMLGRLEVEKQQQLQQRLAISSGHDDGATRSSTLDWSALLNRYCDAIHRSVFSSTDVPPAAQGAFTQNGRGRKVAADLLDLAASEWLFDGRSAENLVMSAILLSITSLGMNSRWKEAVCTSLGVKMNKLNRRVAELRAVALGVVRSLPGRADTSDFILLRGLSTSLHLARLERSAAALALERPLLEEAECVDESPATAETAQPYSTPADAARGNGQRVVHVEPGSQAQKVDQLPSGVPLAHGHVNLPPSYVSGLAKRRRLQSKLDAVRLCADGAATEFDLDRDCEARRVEAAWRRGVPEEAILQGYFDTAPVTEDRHLSIVDAPHLFEEELSASDLPDEHLRSYLRDACDVRERALFAPI